MTQLGLTFVHLTDLHLKAEDVQDETLLNDTEQALRQSFAEIARLASPPAFIAISGDLANRGDVPAYRRLAELIEELAGDLPVVYALGNHDKREGFAAVFGHLYPDPSKPYDHDCVIGGLHLITLDSSVPGQVGGGLEPAQIEWLDARLAEHGDLPKLIMIHHGPLLDPERGGPAWDSLDPASTEALRRAVAGRSVVGILAGHIHMDRVAHWFGVPVVIGSGHHVATDPLAPRGQIHLLSATSLVLCALQPSGLTTTFIPHPQDRRLRQQIEIDSIRVRDEAAQRARGGREAV